ncbi:prepilin-type N-terminal cleavage/methylation domain-containing protein [Patescibacteria group bacterium]|nr:prepilin-type N-terminal cleavage/methylation domain-containing protein [Patescibacteria group bacterium]
MKKRRNGQSLIEVLAALAVVVIVILALITVTTISIRNATFAKNQSLATNYAQELIEKARDLRDSDKEAFFTDESLCDKPTDSVPPFTLERVCTLVGEDKMQVLATATWTDAHGDHKSELYTELTKW